MPFTFEERIKNTSTSYFVTCDRIFYNSGSDITTALANFATGINAKIFKASETMPDRFRPDIIESVSAFYHISFANGFYTLAMVDSRYKSGKLAEFAAITSHEGKSKELYGLLENYFRSLLVIEEPKSTAIPISDDNLLLDMMKGFAFKHAAIETEYLFRLSERKPRNS